jgi:hypothetical protein
LAVPGLKKCFARFPILACDVFTAENTEVAEQTSVRFLFLLDLLGVLGDLGGEMLLGLL